MIDKDIGFSRTIQRTWLDAAAAFCAELNDPAEIRARLEPVVGEHLRGVEARRKTIDVLLAIWLKSRETSPTLYDWAVDWFRQAQVPADRLWLHYGLSLLTYSFFRECAIAIGQFSRYEDAVTNKMLKQRLISERGHLGALDRSAERIVASLRDWGVLHDSAQRYAYAPARQAFVASSIDLEAWLLACALLAHPAEELPFADLLRLPELFPFRFTLGVDDLRRHPWFGVQRQGIGWEMVRVEIE